MRSFEVQGKWWLPNNDKKQIPGTLRFNPTDGATLELLGSFGDPVSEAFLGTRYTSIIGFGVDGRPYTIFWPFFLRSKTGTTGVSTVWYGSTLVLQGAHYASTDDVPIRQVTCRFWSLDEWVALSGFNIKNPDRFPWNVTIRYRQPKPLTFKIDSRLRLLIWFSSSASNLLFPGTSVSIEHNARLGLESVGNPFSLKEAIDYVHYLQDFLTLGIGEPTQILECNVILTEENDEGHASGHGTLFWPQRFIQERQDSVQTDEMLFSRRDLGNRLRVYIKNWFNKRVRLDRIFHLYFGTLYNRHLYIESIFLSYVQALELYHRVYGSTKRAFPPKEHTRLVKSIIRSAPKEYHEWLKGKLKYNEPSLRQRLREVWDLHGDILNEHVRDKKGFIHKVVATRNDLVHPDGPRKDSAATNLEELVEINRTLSLIINLCLLHILGMSIDQRKSLVERHKRLLRGLWGQGRR